MLVLYRTRIIKVTDRFRRIVIGATLGVMVLYLVSFVISLFGGDDRRSSTSRALFGIAVQRLRLRPRGVQPGPRLRLHRARLARRAWPRTTSGSPPSACSSPSSGCTSRSCACWPSCSATEPPCVRLAGSAAVAVGGRRCSPGATGCADRACHPGGGRRGDARRHRRLPAHLSVASGHGWVGFALDHSWALLTSSASLSATSSPPCLARARPVPELSGAAEPPRVPRRPPVRPGFVLTSATRSAVPATSIGRRSERLIKIHEDVARVADTGVRPALSPRLRSCWAVVVGPAACTVGVCTRRASRSALYVEGWAYYLNPFEWWAYSREGRWPPKPGGPAVAPPDGARPRVAAERSRRRPRRCVRVSNDRRSDLGATIDRCCVPQACRARRGGVRGGQ